ncbi:hypothetical protein [Campylobacter devanensis]|nr:hypothetical protein [Campylobacter sp. P0111]
MSERSERLYAFRVSECEHMQIALHELQSSEVNCRKQVCTD